MKKLFALLMVLMLAAGCAGCAKPAETGAATEQPAAEAPEPAPAAENNSAAPEQAEIPEEDPAAVRLEGPGYATPEEAVLAYIEAMNRGDAYGMISTFALESFAAHVDPMRWIEHNGSFSAVSSGAVNCIPYSDEYVRSLTAQVRYSAIATELNSCYAMYALGSDTYYNHYDTAEDRRMLAEQFRGSVLNHIAGNVEFVQWINPAVLSGGNLVIPGAGGDTMENLAYTGADDLTEMAALIRINGKPAVQAMCCAKYEGRWYNLSFGSNALRFRPEVRDVYKRTLWIPSDEEAENLMPLLALAEGEYAEDAARWTALQQSDWAGTRWPMVSLDLPGVTVHETAGAAENDSGAGIYAEMHFTRVGGAMITITASPALRQQLGVKDTASRIRFSWFADEIPVSRTSSLNGKEMPLFRLTDRKNDALRIDLEGLTVNREDARVTFTLADGTRAVFRKPEAAAPAQAENVVPAARLEGGGYDTPEEAVLAYVDALNRGDARGMLSTFAIETYAAHTDPMVYVEQLGGYFASTNYHIPYQDDYGRSLLAAARYGSLADSLLSSYLSYAIDYSSARISLKTDEDIRAFRDQFVQSPLSGIAGNVSFVRWMDPVVMSHGMIASPGGRATEMDVVALSGADDIAEPVAELLINGRTAYVGLRCGRYDGRWYNLQLSNFVMITSQAPAQKTSLWMPDPMEQAQLLVSLGGITTEALNGWNAIGRAGLGGTRWTMISLSAPDITVHETADAALNDSGAGVRAELHFTGIGGGILTVTGSPVLRQALGMEDESVRIIFAWDPDTAAEGGLILSGFRVNPRTPVGLNLENLTVARDDSAITVSFPDGMQAVFRKAE